MPCKYACCFCDLTNAFVISTYVKPSIIRPTGQGLTFCFTFHAFRCRRLPKGLKDWQAFLELKKKIDDFSESCPLLELMANKAMKERHWDRMAKLTGHTFDFDSEGFTLRDIMKAPLLRYKEDIEVSIL